MKTLTEFFGPTLRKAQEEVEKLMPAKVAAPKKSGKKGKQEKEASVEAAQAGAVTQEATSAETPAIETAAEAPEALAATESVEATIVEAAPAEAAPVEAAAPVENPEEKVAARLTELYKLEGDKLDWFRKSIDLVRTKRGNLKRVIVGQLNENEKAPSGFTEIEGKVYGIEFYPEAGRAQQPRRDDRDDRGGRKGGRGKGRGGKGGRGKGDRNERGSRPEGLSAGGDRPSGDRSRKPRPPRAPAEPYTGPNRIIPKSKQVEPAAPAGESSSSS